MSTIQSGNQKLYYEMYGKGEPVIFIPGLGASRLGWTKQIQAFSKRYLMIIMDNRDAGDSGLSVDPYAIADMADDVASVLKSISAKPANIVGISMGSFIAQHLYLRHPECVKKLVLVSSTAGGSSHVQPDPEVIKVLHQNPDEDKETYVRRLQTAATGPGFASRSPNDFELLVGNALKFTMSQNAYMRQFSAAKSHYSEGTQKYLATVRVPTLIVHGECDPLVPFANGQALAKQIPASKIISFPSVGHLPHIESTERFNQEVIQFLEN